MYHREFYEIINENAVYRLQIPALLLNQLIFYCLTENILVSNQYGYNTTDCLVDLIDAITKALDEEKYAVSIFLDLSKAFDTVNHSDYYFIQTRPICRGGSRGRVQGVRTPPLR